MPDHIAARKQIVDELKQELVGPNALGEPIDVSGDLVFSTFKEAERPRVQVGSGEEILSHDRPFKRYGVGVLYPLQAPASEPTVLADEAEPTLPPDDLKPGTQEISVKDDRSRAARGTPEDDDLPLPMATARRPSSFGLSFVVASPPGSSLAIRFSGGHYTGKAVTVEGRPRTWWLRRPVSTSAEITAEQLTASHTVLKPELKDSVLPGGLSVQIMVVTRPRDDCSSLVTVSVVNRSAGITPDDSAAIFQVELEVTVRGPDGAGILPYDEREKNAIDDEVASLELLYRDVPAFAIGHGCAADWESPDSDPSRGTSCVRSAVLPVTEVPSTTPDIADAEGVPITVRMATLADGDTSAARGELNRVVAAYETWIRTQEQRVDELAPAHREAASEHLRLCWVAHARMLDGLEFLENEQAREAFELANRAIAMQQRAGRQSLRRVVFDRDEQRFQTEPANAVVDEDGEWRAFQIAFVLATLRSTVTSPDRFRSTVDLIFFPTGGGKTEAYLALTAFSLLYRRLSDSDDIGVDVIMRYTLRLLTAQQFQRASGLICAMEQIRRTKVSRFGDTPFTIGVWLGSGVTPNYRKDALDKLRHLRSGRDPDNPFVMLRCPSCAAQMGPVSATGKQSAGRGRPNKTEVAGYKAVDETVRLHCPDRQCDFHRELPIFVIDQDIYAERPSVIIGTVDKFAQLPFVPQARSLFGLGPDGTRIASPPNLIIQDELHLISGPLGSMVGLYEGLIEELCTDRRSDTPVPPKIIASTATIRRYQRQVKDLYNRDETHLFPPRGLDAGDSFFARYAQDKAGTPLPGRVYVGVHAPGLGSLQTAQVRTFAALAQAAQNRQPDERDPWWTLLLFFNSLRELGTTLSLFQSDVPDYLYTTSKRTGRKSSDIRRLWQIEELTGRLRNDEVPRAIEKLEVEVDGRDARPVDVCLASNIVEVGIDITRLSLMSVVGQPKTTAQYIQATGRVGRNWKIRPGLVVTLYGASKPRDRSHFEKFRSYHERLYAQVEPTSVTPFSPPVLDRALHAVVVGYVRQFGPQAGSPRPVPEELLDAAHHLLRTRVEAIDPAELERFDAVFERRRTEWRKWDRVDWMRPRDSDDIALMRFAGSHASGDELYGSWPVPNSMRAVDAQCNARVSEAYNRIDEVT